MNINNIIVQNVYYEYFTENFYMDIHRHPAYEITYVSKGLADIEFYNDKEKLIKNVMLYPNNFMIINTEVLHRMRIPKQSDAYILNIELLVNPEQTSFTKIYPEIYTLYDLSSIMPLQKFVNNTDEFSHCTKLRKIFDKDFDFLIFEDTQEIVNIIHNIHHECLDPKNNYESLYLLKLFLLEFFINVSRCPIIDQSEKKGNIHINKTINFLKNNYQKTLCMDDIAQFVGIDKFYLQKVFKKHTNKTVMNFLNSLRIEKAKDFLKQGFSVSDTYKACGFGNRQTFSRVFADILHLTPQQYKLNSSFQPYNLGPQKGQSPKYINEMLKKE